MAAQVDYGSPKSAADIPMTTGAPDMLYAMHVATTRLGLWEWFRDVEPPKETGYWWWDDAKRNALANASEVRACDHSGATLAWCMRQMQHLARVGWSVWVMSWDHTHLVKK